VLDNGILFVAAPFDHPIGNIVIQMVENYNTEMVDDAKMLEGASASSFLSKIIIWFCIDV